MKTKEKQINLHVLRCFYMSFDFHWWKISIFIEILLVIR